MTRAIPLVAFAWAIAVATVLAATDQTEVLWGLDGFGDRRLIELSIATVAFVLVATVPPLARLVDRAITALPLPTRGIGPFVVGAIAAAACWMLPSRDLVGDWGLVLGRFVDGTFYPSNLGANLLFRAAAVGTDAAALPPDAAIRATSALCGGVFVAHALRIAGRLATTPSEARFIAVMTLATGATALFFGHIEVYAPLLAAFAIVLDTALLVRAGRARPGTLGLVVGIAICMHGLAAVFAPVLAWHAWRSSPGHRTRALALFGALLALPVALAAGALWAIAWEFTPPTDAALRYGTFLGAAGQTPWTPLFPQPGYEYALATADHWIQRANVLLRIAPVGVALALVAGRRNDRSGGLLRACAAVALVWTALHNVSYPVDRDWDLFALAGLLVTWLGAAAFAGASARTHGVCIAAALYCAVPWWLTAVDPLPERTVAYHRGLARIYQARNDAAGFEWHLAASARVMPPDGEALADASTYFMSRERWVEAEPFVTRGAATYPNDGAFASKLAILRFRRGRVADALGPMETAVAMTPDNASLRHTFGQMLRRAQRPAAAVEQLERAADLAPAERTYTIDYFELASDPLVNRGREALPRLARLADRLPDDVDLLRRLRDAYRRHGLLEEAGHAEGRLIDARRRAAERANR